MTGVDVLACCTPVVLGVSIGISTLFTLVTASVGDSSRGFAMIGDISQLGGMVFCDSGVTGRAIKTPVLIRSTTGCEFW